MNDTFSGLIGPLCTSKIPSSFLVSRAGGVIRKFLFLYVSRTHYVSPSDQAEMDAADQCTIVQ